MLAPHFPEKFIEIRHGICYILENIDVCGVIDLPSRNFFLLQVFLIVVYVEGYPAVDVHVQGQAERSEKVRGPTRCHS